MRWCHPALGAAEPSVLATGRGVLGACPEPAPGAQRRMHGAVLVDVLPEPDFSWHWTSSELAQGLPPNLLVSRSRATVRPDKDGLRRPHSIGQLVLSISYVRYSRCTV